MTKPPPCTFRIDVDTPADHLGRPYCVCGAVKDNPRHELPDEHDAQHAHASRYEHDEEE